jgi:hypothetical protein
MRRDRISRSADCGLSQYQNSELGGNGDKKERGTTGQVFTFDSAEKVFFRKSEKNISHTVAV